MKINYTDILILLLHGSALALPQNIDKKDNNGNKDGAQVNSKRKNNARKVAADASFCKSVKLALTDGKQNKKGSCSTTVQGAIPSFDNMVSTLITSPASGSTVDAQKAFNISIDNINLDTGFFSDAKTQYYAEPQQLNKDGNIKGHQHITVQFLGDGKSALDARQFDFFKGLNDRDVNGVLSVEVPPGSLKSNGAYRICSITGTFNHQPVIMPVAQRGSQDDCIRINVKGAGNNGGKTGKGKKNNLNRTKGNTGDKFKDNNGRQDNKNAVVKDQVDENGNPCLDADQQDEATTTEAAATETQANQIETVKEKVDENGNPCQDAEQQDEATTTEAAATETQAKEKVENGNPCQDAAEQDETTTTEAIPAETQTNQIETGAIAEATPIDATTQVTGVSNETQVPCQ